jgi:hypothetical protein
MQAFLVALLASVSEKLISIGITDVEGWLSQLTARAKQYLIDQKNEKKLAADQASGNQDAIDKDAQDLLNGVDSAP